MAFYPFGAQIIYHNSKHISYKLKLWTPKLSLQEKWSPSWPHFAFFREGVLAVACFCPVYGIDASNNQGDGGGLAQSKDSDSHED